MTDRPKIPPVPYATDEEVAAVLARHPIFGPAMRGETTRCTVAPAYGINSPPAPRANVRLPDRIRRFPNITAVVLIVETWALLFCLACHLT